jgi:hypothetical protein
MLLDEGRLVDRQRRVDDPERRLGGRRSRTSRGLKLDVRVDP